MRVKSKCDMIVDDILSKMAGQIYIAGDRLPTEQEFCKIYDVSRVTVRESLKKLQMMDVISIEQGRGTFVKGVGLGHFMKPVLSLIDFEDFDIRTIYDARLYIETGTSKLAAMYRTEEDLGKLSALMDVMQTIMENWKENSLSQFREYDTEFHIQVAQASHNEILKATVINLEQISRAVTKRMNKQDEIMEHVHQEHMEILEAIRRRDPDGAVTAMAAHTKHAMAFLG